MEIQEEIIEKCETCHNVILKENRQVCKRFGSPSAKWRVGSEPDNPAICPMATHVKRELTQIQKQRIGQQKQKKKG